MNSPLTFSLFVGLVFVFMYEFKTLVNAHIAEGPNSLHKDEEDVATQTEEIIVDTTKTLHITSRRYLSLTIDMDTFRWNWKGFHFSSGRLQNIAAALAPSFIRFGGLYSDFLQFDPEGNSTVSPPPRQYQTVSNEADPSQLGFFDLGKKVMRDDFKMTGDLWDKVSAFCDQAGWDIMFTLNLFYLRDGYWDPTNAISFLNYSAERGVAIPAFVLGNEPNLFHYKFDLNISMETLAEDYRILRSVLSRFPQYDSSSLYGPGVTTLDRHETARENLAEFLKAGGCDIVNEVTIHQYYGASNATVDDFIDPNYLDTLRDVLDISVNITARECNFKKPTMITETSSCHGGGTIGLSDAYIAGFTWLDKLGLAAKYGITHVLRQSFYGGSYSLVDEYLNPNPDYFLSVLYKRLIEGPVFDVISSSSTRRVYAHCARRDFYNYPEGALALYYLNLEDHPITVDSELFLNNKAIDLFLLTPGDHMGLASRSLTLNQSEWIALGSTSLDHKKRT